LYGPTDKSALLGLEVAGGLLMMPHARSAAPWVATTLAAILASEVNHGATNLAISRAVIAAAVDHG
jgi:hypothetical protein